MLVDCSPTPVLWFPPVLWSLLSPLSFGRPCPLVPPVPPVIWSLLSSCLSCPPSSGSSCPLVHPVLWSPLPACHLVPPVFLSFLSPCPLVPLVLPVLWFLLFSGLFCPTCHLVPPVFSSYLSRLSSGPPPYPCPPQTAIIPSTEDVTISFLPLAHMFERVVQVRLRLLSLTPASIGLEVPPEDLCAPPSDGGVQCGGQGGLLPGGRSPAARRHEDSPADHLPRCPSTPQPHL